MRRLTKTFCGPAHRPLIAERGDVAFDRQPPGLLADLHEIGALAEELKEPLAQPRRRRTLQQRAPAAGEREAHLRIAERHLGDEPRDLRRFGGVGLEELAPRRQVVEEIFDLDRRALGHARLALRRDGAAVDADLGAGGAAARARAQREVRHRRDARQRLAAEPERPNRGEILRAGDLARRMTLDRQPRILRLHALAVVLDADRLLAAELDRDRDAARAGVERVLDQLLDDRGRPLDDFAGRDLVGELQRQAVDAPHAATTSPCGGRTPASRR